MVHGGRRAGTALLVAVMALVVSGGVAAAHGGASIEVKKAWARTSPVQANNGAVYMVLRNESKSDQALVGASVPASVAMETQLHETVMGSGGTMQMQEVDEIAIPARSTVKLEPGGYHIMLMGLAAPLETGSKIKVTLEFESGKTKIVKAVVKQ
jgi:hypothetical protein